MALGRADAAFATLCEPGTKNLQLAVLKRGKARASRKQRVELGAGARAVVVLAAAQLKRPCHLSNSGREVRHLRHRAHAHVAAREPAREQRREHSSDPKRPQPRARRTHRLATGCTTRTPSSASTARWRAVKGLCHMAVFIAGATSTGLR